MDQKLTKRIKVSYYRESPLETKSKVVVIRLTPKERKALDAEAKRSAQTISDVLMRPWRERKG